MTKSKEQEIADNSIKSMEVLASYDEMFNSEGRHWEDQQEIVWSALATCHSYLRKPINDVCRKELYSKLHSWVAIAKEYKDFRRQMRKLRMN